MVIKEIDNEKVSLKMILEVNWEPQKINIFIERLTKRNGRSSGWSYPTEQFPAAIKKFNELEIQSKRD